MLQKIVVPNDSFDRESTVLKQMLKIENHDIASAIQQCSRFVLILAHQTKHNIANVFGLSVEHEQRRHESNVEDLG